MQNNQLSYSILYTHGNENYHGSCVGCYWYDPLEFNKEISKKKNQK